MRRIHTICLFVVTACLMGAGTGQSDPQTDADKRKLLGKWEVVSAQRDGKAQHGQVGREQGDVITIELDAFGKPILG